eukprot:1186061-Prorocentrum_minimum.AAC.2
MRIFTSLYAYITVPKSLCSKTQYVASASVNDMMSHHRHEEVNEGHANFLHVVHQNLGIERQRVGKHVPSKREEPIPST